MFYRNSWVLDARISGMVLLVFCFFAVFPPSSHGALVESRLSGGELVSQRAEQIETIRMALETEVVAQRLADFGLSKEEIMAKLPTLSDEQLHQLAGLSDTLAEGGALGAVIAILVIVLLVILILKITDKQVIIR
jgi:hypothetical protein